MKYNLVEIRPKWKPKKNENPWRIDYRLGDGQDRVAGGVPHALGFYHCPAKMPPEKAFEKLRAAMVKRHKEEIQRLQKSLNMLEGLKWTTNQ